MQWTFTHILSSNGIRPRIINTVIPVFTAKKTEAQRLLAQRHEARKFQSHSNLDVLTQSWHSFWFIAISFGHGFKSMVLSIR